MRKNVIALIFVSMLFSLISGYAMMAEPLEPITLDVSLLLEPELIERGYDMVVGV